MNMSARATTILGILVVTLLSQTMYARPPPEWLYSQWKDSKFDDSDTDNFPIVPRTRRLSDQRMAELETLMALEKIKGIAVPVGLGKVDPAALGRKRRSISMDPEVISVTLDTNLADLIRLSLMEDSEEEQMKLPADYIIENDTRE